MRAVVFGVLIWIGLAARMAQADAVLQVVKDIEQELQARVGLYVHDLQSGLVTEHRAQERFALNSTFKLFACGALLARVDQGESALDDLVALDGVEVVTYSPAIEAHLESGAPDVSLGAACGMMLSVSDNTAANVVLAEIGGPQGMTAFMRQLGDEVTRLDRWETALNEARPGDARDTTQPQAIAGALQALLLGDVLSDAAQGQLQDWLEAHQVADALFRSVLPDDWRIEDRTGAGGYGARSIIAVLYPPERAPVIAVVFLAETEADFQTRNAAIARIGAAIIDGVKSVKSP